LRVKFVFFGLTISSAWGNGHATPYRAILKALRRMGHHITFFEKDVPYYAQHRDLTACGYCDLVLYPDWDQARERALQEARQADVVICASYLPDGARINDDVLDLRGPTRAFYDLDTPVTLSHWQRGESVEYLRPDQVSGFDLILSFTGGRIISELVHKYGAQRAWPLFGCVDPDQHRRVPPEPEFACDLSYMGTFAPGRQHKFEELFLKPATRNDAMTFLLAGSLYPWDMELPSNVLRFEHISPEQHSALYSSSTATLNLTRAEMAAWGYCPSGRFFEAAACGTPVISDWWEGLETFFHDGAEVFVADTGGEVAAALRFSRAELRRMGERARERTLDEHTGDVRARQLLAAIESGRERILGVAG
jgi:spore maturation protein CgeB